MLETIYATQFARNRHRAAPLLEERERYLQHCAAHGSTHRTQYQRAEELLWLAQRMQPDDRQGVDADRLRQLIEVKPEPSRAHASRAEIHGRNWLKFLGWWRTPPNPVPFEADLKHFVCWIFAGRDGKVNYSVTEFSLQPGRFRVDDREAATGLALYVFGEDVRVRNAKPAQHPKVGVSI